jgi:predicted RNA binding protein YcfA (HicA-like mRNA interferase family)
MGSFPVASGEEVVRALLRAGFTLVSQRGSHVKLRNASGRTVIIPITGSRDLKTGTLRSILRQAGITDDELRALL